MAFIPVDDNYKPYAVISGPTGDLFQATVFAPGELRVQEEPTNLFLDDFASGTLDTTNRWKTPTAAGGGIAASNAVGSTVLGTGTTANGYSYLESVPSFIPRNPGWNQFQTSINLPAPYIGNTYFFFGLATSPTTPTAAAPIQEGAGFEVAVGGKMYAVCYAAGTRNQIADLSASGNNKQPTDSNVHIYTLFWRGDRAYWCIDSIDNVVASITTGALGPNLNTLPIKFSAIAGTSAPGSNGQLTVNQVFVADTTRGNMQLSDGTYPFRKATITSANALKVDGSAVTQPVSGTVTANATLQSGLALVGGAMDYEEMVARSLAGTFKALNASVAINNNGGAVATITSYKDQLNNTYTTVTSGKTLYVSVISLVCDISTTSGVIQSSLVTLDDGSSASNIKYQALVTGSTLPVPVRGMISFTQTTTPTFRINPSNLTTAIGKVYVQMLCWEE